MLHPHLASYHFSSEDNIRNSQSRQKKGPAQPQEPLKTKTGNLKLKKISLIKQLAIKIKPKLTLFQL